VSSSWLGIYPALLKVRWVFLKCSLCRRRAY
jgi:hypothetical protein